jgi:hypothetical protein
LQEALQDGLDLGRDVQQRFGDGRPVQIVERLHPFAPDLGRRRRLLELVLQKFVGDRPGREGRLAGQQEVHRTAKTVQVCADVAGVRVARLLGGDELRRPHHRADQGQLRAGAAGDRVGAAGQPHVEDFYRPPRRLGQDRPGEGPVAFFSCAGACAVATRGGPAQGGAGVNAAAALGWPRPGDHEVLRFDVAVDHAALVGVLQAKGGLADVVARLLDAQRPLFAHQPGQVVPLDQLHREVIGVVRLVGVEGADDVGMTELAGGPDLADESFHRLGVVQALFADDLQGDDAFENALAGLENLPHSPFAEPFEQQERAEHQGGGPPLEDLIDLIRGEPFTPEQLLRELARVAGVCFQPAKFHELIRVEDLALHHSLHEAGNRGERHGDSGASATRAGTIGPLQYSSLPASVR